jgi:hypothetical protein
MKRFLSAVPGSFNTDWGEEVWKRVGEHHESEDQGQDEPVLRPRDFHTLPLGLLSIVRCSQLRRFKLMVKLVKPKFDAVPSDQEGLPARCPESLFSGRAICA